MSSNHAGTSAYIDWKMLYETDPSEVLRKKVQEEQFTRLMREKPRPNSLLDVGCGLGSFWPFLSDVHVIGMEVNLSPTAIRRAKQHGVDLVLGDAHHLPFKEGSFDLVLEREVLEHLEMPILVLRETSRILRDGGALLVSVPSFFDKIILPGLTPVLMAIRKLLTLFLRGRNKQNPHIVSQNEVSLGVGTKVLEILNRCKSKYLSLILMRMFWLLIRAEICMTEHKNKHGWNWVSIIKNTGFTVEDVQACAVLYPITLFLPNEDLPNQLEKRVRSKFPFKYMGDSICVVAHKK